MPSGHITRMVTLPIIPLCGYSDTSRGNYGIFRETGNSDMIIGHYEGY